MTDRTPRVLTVFGTRPEAVKMAPVVERLRRTAGVEARVCVTAQHRQMLDQVLQLFDIVPDYDLDVMEPDQGLAPLTEAIFHRLDPVLEEAHPDWVLVQGDTTTVMATALLAYYRRIRVGHVEAGLRTGDKWQPFPEEINRRVAGVLADLHFAPTELSRQNLLRENVPPERVIVTGNPVIDALRAIAARPYDPSTGPLAGVRFDRRVILVTAHRRENFGSPLERIFTAIRRLASRYDEAVEFVYPVHLNPNVRLPAERMLGDVPNVRLLDPVDYLPMVHLLSRCALVLTDSGGLQEEGPALGKPVLVMRQVTERPEAIEAGTARLVGTDADRIESEVRRLLDDPAAYSAMAHAANPFGDGHAAERIVEALQMRLEIGD
jgi:UDP-N-acetylglucosamine 2-epimerase (non-hydrolysing)